MTNDEAIDPGMHSADGLEGASPRKDRAWVEVARLRQQVREAGLSTAQTREKLRRWLSVVIAVPVGGILLALLALATTVLPLRPLTLVLLAPALVAMSAGFLGLVVFCLTAMPAPTLRRRMLRRRLRACLAELPPSTRSEVLLPMRHAPCEDTRVVVAELIRDLGVSTEVVPASGPGGKGDEVSPTSGAPPS